MPESVNLLREFDDTIIEKLQESYSSRSKIDDLMGISISHEPFTHCIIQNLVSDQNFVNELSSEILSKLKFRQKNNDLYQFHQTQDLGKNKSKNLSKFRDQFLYGQFLEVLKKITNIDLSSTKIDVTSSKYEFSDYLLCHDDNINQDKHGRRIAFIYYLVPEDWSQNGSDGGNLDLFRVDDNYEPVEIVKSLIPRRNSLAFFEVSDSSFHQVAQILSRNKTRLSINGWFHGPVNPRADKKIQLPPELKSYDSVEPDTFFDWITERYLKPLNQTGIQMKFSSSSEIKLDKFFHQEKYDQVNKALSSENLKWIKKGTYNRHNYEIADNQSLPVVVKELLKVLTSDFMGLTLSNMTGLALHPTVPKTRSDETDSDSYSEDDDEEPSEEIENQDDNEFSDSDSEILPELTTMSPSKRKLSESEENDGSKPCCSSSLNKKFKNDEDLNENGQKSDLQSDESQREYGNPKYNCEIRRWKPGSYTLITDDDDEIKKEALDLMVYFGCQNWHSGCGGNVSYIARDEDTELLTVNPEENCLALVFRDKETLRFTKFVNSRLTEMTSNGYFYEIYIVYYE